MATAPRGFALTCPHGTLSACGGAGRRMAWFLLALFLLPISAAADDTPDVSNSPVLAEGLTASATATAPIKPTLVVYRSPDCACCEAWINQVRDSDFTVIVNDVADIVETRVAQGVPDHLGGCHTATVDGYLLGGHVPVADIKRLLAEQPKLVGLFVPGMPSGAPGMGGAAQAFDVVALDPKNNETVYARHESAEDRSP